MTIKVRHLRSRLENAIDNLNAYDDDEEVRLAANSGFGCDCDYMYVSGTGRRGFVNLEDIEIAEDDEDEDDEE